jgi:hypothetical protein
MLCSNRGKQLQLLAAPFAAREGILEFLSAGFLGLWGITRDKPVAREPTLPPQVGIGRIFYRMLPLRVAPMSY